MSKRVFIRIFDFCGGLLVALVLMFGISINDRGTVEEARLMIEAADSTRGRLDCLLDKLERLDRVRYATYK